MMEGESIDKDFHRKIHVVNKLKEISFEDSELVEQPLCLNNNHDLRVDAYAFARYHYLNQHFFSSQIIVDLLNRTTKVDSPEFAYYLTKYLFMCDDKFTLFYSMDNELFHERLNNMHRENEDGYFPRDVKIFTNIYMQIKKRLFILI
jgi:hypothetical protein